MQTSHVIYCPNCGSRAERHYFTSLQSAYLKCLGNQVTQTECPACDYLTVICSLNGSVVEAYAPGIKAPTAASKSQPVSKTPRGIKVGQVALLEESLLLTTAFRNLRRSN